MSRFAWLLATMIVAGVAATSFAAEFHELSVRIEPPQRVLAITLESNGTTVPVAVTNGKAKIPAELPLPWKVAQLRFEPTIYTESDLAAQRPLLLREFGRLTGAVREAGHAMNGDFAVLVRANGTTDVEERKVSPATGAAGTFEVRLSAGIYQAVITSDSCGTRLRSGIVIKPGVTTDLGAVSCDATFAVSFRVIDAKSGAPIAGAKVLWDPSDTVNAQDAKVMYGRRWSATTDRRGAVAIRVGPAPIPVRWRVEANGYATESTRRFELFESKEATIADVKLQRTMALRVRVHLPVDAPEFAGGAVVLGEHPDEQSLRFQPKARQALHAGEVTFKIDTFGEKRVWLENASGTRLCYRDIRVVPEMTVVDLSPQAVEIHGRVVRRDLGVEDASIVLGDPHDAHLVLAKTRTDAAGHYSLKTYQSGELSLYATQYDKHGLASNPLFKKLSTTADSTDYLLDFELPGGGITVAVTDAATHVPVAAMVDAHFTMDNGNQRSGRMVHTDDSGRVTFEGYPEGTATLDVSAPGYRAQEVEFPLHGGAVETHEVALARGAAITGRVVTQLGTSVPGAVITAGYDDEINSEPRFQATSDSDGRFIFDSPPEPGMVFYIVAPGWALAIANLESGSENIVTLWSPSSIPIYLTEDNGAPKRVYRVVAAPAGGDFIPSGVLEDLAEANGMNTFQLLGSGRDGAVVLPEFLAPGTYDFFTSQRPPKGQTQLLYDRLGRLTLPCAKATTLRVGSKQAAP